MTCHWTKEVDYYAKKEKKKNVQTISIYNMIYVNNGHNFFF